MCSRHFATANATTDADFAFCCGKCLLLGGLRRGEIQLQLFSNSLLQFRCSRPTDTRALRTFPHRRRFAVNIHGYDNKTVYLLRKLPAITCGLKWQLNTFACSEFIFFCPCAAHNFANSNRKVCQPFDRWVENVRATLWMHCFRTKQMNDCKRFSELCYKIATVWTLHFIQLRNVLTLPHSQLPSVVRPYVDSNQIDFSKLLAKQSTFNQKRFSLRVFPSGFLIIFDWLNDRHNTIIWKVNRITIINDQSDDTAYTHIRQIKWLENCNLRECQRRSADCESANFVYVTRLRPLR